MSTPSQDVKSGQELEALVKILQKVSQRINQMADTILVEPAGAEKPPESADRKAKAEYCRIYDRYNEKYGNEVTILYLLGNSFKKGGIVSWTASEQLRKQVKDLFSPKDETDAKYLAEWNEIEGSDFETLARKYLEIGPGSAVSPQQQETLQRLYEGIETSVKNAIVRSKNEAFKMFNKAEKDKRADNPSFFDSLRLLPKLVRDSMQENLKVSLRSSLTSQDLGVGDQFDTLSKNISSNMKEIEDDILKLPDVKGIKDTQAVKALKLALLTFVSGAKDIIQETLEQCGRYVDKPEIPEGALREIDKRGVSLKTTLEENLKKFKEMETGAETDPSLKTTAQKLSERAEKAIAKLDNRHKLIENMLRERVATTQPSISKSK